MGDVRFMTQEQRDGDKEIYLGSVGGRDRVDRGGLGVTCVARKRLRVVGQGCDGTGGHVDDVIKARSILKGLNGMEMIVAEGRQSEQAARR